MSNKASKCGQMHYPIRIMSNLYHGKIKYISVILIEHQKATHALKVAIDIDSHLKYENKWIF